MSPTVIRGPYFQDVLSQSQSLGSLCEELARTTLPSSILKGIADGRFRRVVLTGMGSSLHALYPTERRCGELLTCFQRIETAEMLAGYKACFNQDTLLIAVSQSGESAEIVQLLKRANEFGQVIGVTNDSQSSLSRLSGTTIHLRAGNETSVSCKTYICTLAAMHWLSSQIVGGSATKAIQDIRAAQHAVSEYLSNWQSHVEQWIPWIDDAQSVFVTGRGDSLATAWTAGLILKESTRRHAEGMSSAAFRHGPMEMAGENALVIVFEGSVSDALMNRRLVDDIRIGGGKAVLIRASDLSTGEIVVPALASSLSPLAEILSIQMLSLAMAARDGNEAGRFERASKITVVA